MAAAATPAPAPTPAGTPSTTSWAPTAKVSVGVLTAGLVTLLMPFWKRMLGTDLSAAEGAALTSVLTFIVQYLVPDRK
jgi:hypothetical protein